jgi:hypothetical protein
MNAETIKTCREALTQLREIYRQEIYALDLNNELAKQELVDKFRAIDASMADLDAPPAAPVPVLEENELVEAVKFAYRKHHLEDENIGWDELSDKLADALSNAMGPRGFADWLDALRQEAGNE